MSDYSVACLATVPVAYWRLGEADYYYNAVRRSVPISYWRLNEATPGTGACADDMGANAGTYVASPTGGVTGAITNDTNKAVTFNGTTQNATVPDSASLDLGDVFTIEAWISKSGTGYRAIVSKGTNAYYLRLNPDDTLSLLKDNVAVLATSTATVGTGFHHVVATKNGAAIYIYLDGTDVTGAVANETCSNTALVLTIGCEAVTSLERFAGTLDEVAVYNRALSAAEVSAHFAAKSGPAPSTNAADASGNAHTGTYVGYPTLGATGALTGDSDTGMSVVPNQYMKTATDAAFDATTAVTVAAWVKFASVVGTDPCILSHFKTGDLTGYELYLHTNGKARLLIGDGTNYNLGGDGGASLADNAWHFVVATRAGSVVTQYVDASAVYTGPTDGASVGSMSCAGASVISVGAYYTTTPSAYLTGSIDEPAVWNRALSVHEIEHLYAVGKQTHIAGVTRDASGNVLVSAKVRAYYTDDGTPDGAEATSDASTGAFSLLAGPAQHFLVARKAGSPEVAASSVSTLVGS
jgi:hypothetical protein